MYSAAELIHALQRRLLLRAPHLRRAPGEFPPGWQRWFAEMPERADAVIGATSAAITDVLLQRPQAERGRQRAGELTRWQAFATLWRQQWHPPEPEDRGVRVFSGTISLLWHIFFGALLIYLMYLQYLGLMRPPPQGETVVQVEFIGEGTPQEPGGGEPAEQPREQPAETAAAEEASAPTAAAAVPMEAAAAAQPTPVLEVPVPDVPQREVPEPQIPTPPVVEQPVAVSEARTQEPAEFVLVAPTLRVTEPKIAAPELSAPTRAVQAIEVPEPVQPITRELPQRELVAPQVSARVPEVAVREVPAPLQRAPVRELPTPTIATPELRSTTPQVRVAEIPTPSRTPAAAAPAPAATAPAPTAATAATTAPAAAAKAPAATAAKPAAASPSATQPSPPGTRAAPSAGTGPKPTAAPGSWPTPASADDWGASTRERPGAQRGEKPGLYNSDGSVRLAEQPGSAAPGMPPGTITQEIKDLDRAGTWLKRKPTDYQPTVWDKYWRPNETLLEEWVRKSVKSVRIPIPGTGKYIVCQTALLALGGGCGIVDPNLNEQPAVARPPPDIPFKPELQEDNGSVKPAPKSPGG